MSHSGAFHTSARMSGIQPADAAAIAQLDDSARADIAKWAEAEVNKAKVRSAIHGFTDLCFKKCVKSADSPALSSAETSCVQNCVGRFLDTNVAIVKMISEQAK